MSPEFSPKAPTKVGTESRSRSSVEVKISGAFLKLHDIASGIYGEAIATAERIDDKLETAIPFNTHAVQAASLVTRVAIRGGQVSS